MHTKRRITGGVLAAIGFILSPLSWWNDLVVNVPLALGFAWLGSLVYPEAFGILVVVGYWLTNIAGFILLHKGTQQVLSKPQPYRRASLCRDLLISLLYTALIILLVKLKVLQPIGAYLLKD